MCRIRISVISVLMSGQGGLNEKSKTTYVRFQQGVSSENGPIRFTDSYRWHVSATVGMDKPAENDLQIYRRRGLLDFRRRQHRENTGSQVQPPSCMSGQPGHSFPCRRFIAADRSLLKLSVFSQTVDTACRMNSATPPARGFQGF